MVPPSLGARCFASSLDKRRAALYNHFTAIGGYPLAACRCGGIGRHKGLKILRKKFRIGSSPISGTIPSLEAGWGFVL